MKGREFVDVLTDAAVKLLGTLVESVGDRIPSECHAEIAWVVAEEAQRRLWAAIPEARRRQLEHVADLAVKVQP